MILAEIFSAIQLLYINEGIVKREKDLRWERNIIEAGDFL